MTRTARLKKGRSASGPCLILADSRGHFEDVVTLETRNRRKRDVTEVLRTHLAEWVGNPTFEYWKDQFLDVAIVAKVNRQRMRRQDVDNIAKVVLDALKETAGDSRFLFRNDNQVARLLVWKVQQTEEEDWNTDTLGISFRVHDPERQMILVQPGTM